MVQEENTGKFLIRVESQNHATWQGTVRWLDEDRQSPFRSALEMICLLDGAVARDEEVLWEDGEMEPEVVQ